MEFEYCALTDVGQLRANNEDAVWVDGARGLAILADGMGGYNAGEVASAIAVERIGDELGQWLDTMDSDASMDSLAHAAERCVESVNRAIFETANTNSACAGMGTTVVLAVARDRQLLIGHIGDSRAYHWHGRTLTQLTRDHSLLQEQLDAGLITPAEAAGSGYRSLITRALGVEDTVLLDTQVVALQADSVVLLCSDGLTEMVPDSDIASVLGSDSELQAQAQALIELANANGGRDNISVVLIRSQKMTKKSGIVGKLWRK